ncbi:MAG: AraC family transcriptional regulator [Clostridiales bacterium]|jgi:AraC-like DNA-binding protein|nr:AraC family transcriptional regulator [Clostridiales bacterium]
MFIKEGIQMRYYYENKGMGIEARYARRLEVGAHMHGHIELILMLRGYVKALVDTQECEFANGDAFIVFPNQVHQFYKDFTSECIICIFPPQICPDIRAVFESRIPVNPVVEKAIGRFGIYPMLCRIVEVSNSAYANADALLKGYFTAVLAELFEVMEFTSAKGSSSTVRDILNYCSRNYMADINLQTLSRELHVSRHYISHLFSEKLHMSFPDYIGMLRVSEAQKLLGGEQSVTEIGYQVGFNSTRSFNRTFSKHMGITPSRYRRGQSGG